MIWSVLADITQDQAMNSIRQTLGQRVDAGMFIWVGLLVVGIVGLIFYFNRRSNRDPSGGINHPGKLVKEVSEAINLKPAELKKLKALAEHLNQNGKPVGKNPLVLLLCPSLLAKAMKKK